ncbi:MAG: membrane protein insertion efficiency factor YidD [Nitrospirota bacterium]|nr:membrane protein insertion efficiency factor YidD [Nitrospirota bacterium]
MRRVVKGSLLVLLLILLQSSWSLRAETAAIHLYQRFGAPVMSYVATCRFRPTCSNYALQVLQEDGFWKGNLHLVQRLIDCSPIGFILSS